jgi:LmbE family N-acetylglucosaminyl deacetylase
MLRLMCITAHPDDEAGAFGGTLRLYRDRGVETCVLCLTPGQAATHRGGVKSDQELSALRRTEFAASCKILGVSQGIVLDYADGQLHRLDSYQVVCEVTRRIRQFRPQVVMTFGPEGAVTAHPDHSMTSMFASLAVQWAGRTNRYPDHFKLGLAPHRVQKLYYGTVDFTLPERQPVALSPISAVVDISEYLDTKIAAFHAHQSQAPLFPIFEKIVQQRGAKETFHLAAKADPGPMEKETDLFCGISDDK